MASLLAPPPGATIFDGTVGGGGHARRLLDLAGEGGFLLGIDRDEAALAASRTRLEGAAGAWRLRKDRFSRVGDILREEGLGPVDAMLFDLGLSSLALDRASRGFSFQAEGPLDMRFGDEVQRTAAEIVAHESERELARLFREYGEEPRARAAARAIVRAREKEPIRTTTELARVLRAVFPPGRENPSLARVFQSLRMTVNEELSELDAVLEQTLDCLAPGGRVAFLSYHSLEDRRVKHAFRAWSGACICPPGLPTCRCGARERANIVTRRPVRPSSEETSRNPRARSARLRVAEKREIVSSLREVGERPPR